MPDEKQPKEMYAAPGKGTGDAVNAGTGSNRGDYSSSGKLPTSSSITGDLIIKVILALGGLGVFGYYTFEIVAPLAKLEEKTTNLEENQKSSFDRVDKKIEEIDETIKDMKSKLFVEIPKSEVSDK